VGISEQKRERVCHSCDCSKSKTRIFSTILSRLQLHHTNVPETVWFVFLNVEAPWSPKTEKAPVSESRGYCLNVSAPFICDWKSFLHSYSNDFTYLGLLKAMLDEIHSMFPTDRREESSLFARATVDLNLVPLNICGRVCVWSETDPRTRICVVCVLRPNHSASLPPFNFSKLFSATTIHYRFALQLECP